MTYTQRYILCVVFLLAGRVQKHQRRIDVLESHTELNYALDAQFEMDISEVSLTLFYELIISPDINELIH